MKKNRQASQFLPTRWEAIVVGLWGIACVAFFHFCYRYHFFFQEQNQLFLLTKGYAASYFQKPAWAACLLGDFLTQFYYYLYAGPVILTLTLLVLGDLARRALQQAGLSRRWAFAAAVILMTVEAIFSLHVTYRLSSVIALAGGMAAFLLASWLFRYGRWAAAATMTILSVLTYWLFGYGLWAFQLLAILYVVCHLRKKPFHWSTCFYFLPVLLAFPIVLMGKGHYYLKADKALTYPGIGKPVLPDFLLEKDFAVDNEYHFGHYGKVEQIVEQADQRTEEMLFFYNLVQAQKGSLPDQLLKYVPNQLGTFYTIGPQTPRLTIINMNELYWVLGDMTLTERAAMMTHVFSPHNRNVRMVKRLAECNLVSGDTLAANKYLRILSKTLAYRSWARDAQDGKGTEYLREKQAFVNKADTIRLTDNLHMVMMELLDSNPRNTVALDYILCSTLLLKDIENFKRDYDRYCYDAGQERVKPLYQQALMIYLAGTNAPEEEWAKYIHDPLQTQRFADYNQHRSDPRFSDTYWYYFDTAKAPKP